MRKLIISNSVLYLALGLLSIALANKTQELTGSLNLYGVTMGMVILSQALGAYIFGRLSRKDKRVYQIKVLLYLMILSGICVWILPTYLLMIISLIVFGTLNGGVEVNLKSYMADLTDKGGRGKMIGNYEAITTLSAGLAMVSTGIISTYLIFPIILLLILISMLIIK